MGADTGTGSGRSSAIATAITRHAKFVLVVMLLATLLVGAGIADLEEDTSLEQFESESEEAEALAYAESNFSAGDEPNETTVQLVATGDDALSRESLVDSLRFQYELYLEDTIADTLVEDEPIVGLANVVATTDIRSETVDELEERRASLETRADDLEREADQLEREADQLEREADELEREADDVESDERSLDEEEAHLEERRDQLAEDGEALQEQADAVNETGDHLADHLNETIEVQQEIEEARLLYEGDEIKEDAYNETVDDAEYAIENEIRANATADLNATQTDRYVDVERQVRDVVGEFAELERQYKAPEEDEEELTEEEYNKRYAALEVEMEETMREGVEDVLAEEIEAVEDERERLETEEEELRERRDELESLDAGRETLEAEREALEAEKADLESRAEELEDERRALQADVDELYGADMPPLEDQIERLSQMSDDEFEALLSDVLAGDTVGNEGEALQMVPHDHEPGSTQADARVTFLTQVTDEAAEGGTTDEDVVESQLELRERAESADENYTVVGSGIVDDDVSRSMTDSLTIVAPLAFVLVVGTLVVAYRDPLDIVLGVAGIVAVLVWTFGLMGWLGFSFNQAFVAIPVLLIGLSIDYAIHVFMRYRERRAARSGDAGGPSGRSSRSGAGSDGDEPQSVVRGSMAVALAGVGVALAWVTATTVLGLLSNLISPVAPIEEFGFVSALGILAAFLIFGTLVPAAKVELDELLERAGFDRERRAFGTGGGRLGQALSIGSTAAVRAPLVVVVLVALMTTAGAAGATQVDTSFEEEHFLADEPPAWTDRLPAVLAPGEYQVKSDVRTAEEYFPHVDAQAQLIVEGNVTDPETLLAVAAAESRAVEGESVATMPDGEADVESPLSTMESVADRNQQFNETFHDADTTGDGVPDRNLTAVYDALFEADADAATTVLHRTDGRDGAAEANGSANEDGSANANGSTSGTATAAGTESTTGEYEAIRLVIGVDGQASDETVVGEMDDVAAVFADGSDRWSTTVTGDGVVTHVMETELFQSVLESMLVTLVTVFAFLSIGYAISGRGVALGAVTLLPVALSVSWVLGTMALLGIPFNVLTAMVTSLTIGLGIDYCLHVSDRYVQELERQGSIASAMSTTVTGTGGALLGSAATAVCGFGVLAFTLVPMLRQFGIVTALSIAYAFLASVLVLPTLLVLYTRLQDADVATETPVSTPATATDGGEAGDRTRGQRHRRRSSRRRR